mmetsp:Transcript_1386/g.3396  ORF Transcript_1386/g.3396 Transcript_1386/m.3396 type:complete len:210 (-) Transcript_1386:746-1375(-)
MLFSTTFKTLSMSSILKGLVMKSKAPAASAFSLNSTSAWAVTKTTLGVHSVSASRLTIILQASRPSMTGICMSISMQSNLLVAEASTAFFPLSTMVTSETPTRFRMRSRTFWLMRLSSATRTLIARGGYCFVDRFLGFGGVARFLAATAIVVSLSSVFVVLNPDDRLAIGTGFGLSSSAAAAAAAPCFFRSSSMVRNSWMSCILRGLEM